MDNRILMWLYKFLSLYLSLWTQNSTREPNKQSTEQTQIPSEMDYTTRVQGCTATFQVIRKHLEPMFYYKGSSTLYLRLYRETYCKEYEEALQCLHELLSQQQPQETLTSIVQTHLSQPWALRTNSLCDINVKHDTAATVGAINTDHVQQKPNNTLTTQNKVAMIEKLHVTWESISEKSNMKEISSTEKILQSEYEHDSEQHWMDLPGTQANSPDKENSHRLNVLFSLSKVQTSRAGRKSNGVQHYEIVETKVTEPGSNSEASQDSLDRDNGINSSENTLFFHLTET